MTDEVVKKSKEPLGLTKGSVRAIIVLSLIGLIAACLGLKISIPEFLVALVIMAVTFYFKDRSDKE
ncbi:MAG: hypothetical protein EHM34_00140 [Nitrosopumilales archaeon]|nr:MAG: hypothetical protein EHM34_00140 [Nitrosopumilales archaeon]